MRIVLRLVILFIRRKLLVLPFVFPPHQQLLEYYLVCCDWLIYGEGDSVTVQAWLSVCSVRSHLDKLAGVLSQQVSNRL